MRKRTQMAMGCLTALTAASCGGRPAAEVDASDKTAAAAASAQPDIQSPVWPPMPPPPPPGKDWRACPASVDEAVPVTVGAFRRTWCVNPHVSDPAWHWFRYEAKDGRRVGGELAVFRSPEVARAGIEERAREDVDLERVSVVDRDSIRDGVLYALKAEDDPRRGPFLLWWTRGARFFGLSGERSVVEELMDAWPDRP